jgi:uncharacterized protein (TIGR03435 family)
MVSNFFYVIDFRAAGRLRTMQRLAVWNNGIKLVLVVVYASLVFGQTQFPPTRTRFEVASVKQNTGSDGRSFIQAVQGRLIMTNLTLRRMILNAYGLQDYQLSGDPLWANSEHYDIQAKADGNPSVREMEGTMLQVLLEDRFKLTIHRETRQLPVYELAIGKVGAKLQLSNEGSCTPYSEDSPPPAATPGRPRPNLCGWHTTPGDGLNRTLDGERITMAVLATALSRTYVSQLGRNVIDATGLTGAYDVHLKWAMDSLSTPAGPNATPLSDATGPSIFTALQEQLGLKLESTKGPVEVLVINHVERPSAN